jgi:hypothetical protein
MKPNSPKRELLKLPRRAWAAPEVWWRALLIVPTPKMHDSGYALIAIIGVDAEDEAQEILAYPDAITWPAQSGYIDSMPDYGGLNTDAYWPSGVLRLFSTEFEFAVTNPVSSVTIKIRKRPQSIQK